MSEYKNHLEIPDRPRDVEENGIWMWILESVGKYIIEISVLKHLHQYCICEFKKI